MKLGTIEKCSKKTDQTKKPVIIVYFILRFFVVLVLIRSVIIGNFENVFICVLTLILFLVPVFIKKNLKIQLPNTLEIIILLFIFAAEILGELESFYIKFEHWDLMLHTTWGFLCAAVGFSLIDILNRDSRIKFNLSPIFVCIVAFCFSMTVGVFWEFFEYAADILLHTDMQKDTVIHSFYSTLLDPTSSNISIPVTQIEQVIINGDSLGINGYLDIGLYDTMEDLFVNFIGAVVFSFIGFFYLKHRGKSEIAHHFIPTLDEDKKTAESK